MANPIAIPGTNVPSGAAVSPGGSQGVQGTQGTQGIAGDAEVGTIKAWPAAAAPASWMIADGSAISRTLYPALYSLIGTTYGAGDGSTTFNLPDLRSRMVVGGGQGTGLSNRALAAKGGEETHQLVIAEMPSHTHTFPFVYYSAQTAGGGGGTGTLTGTTTTSSTGGDGAHNTMPPFLVLVYIIKVSPSGGATAQAPLADSTQSGLLRQVSGNVTDYVGGDNNCHPLPAAYWDPITSGFYWSDDFDRSSIDTTKYSVYVSNGTISINTSSPYGVDTTKKIVGAAEFTTGTLTSSFNGGSLTFGYPSAGNGMLAYGLGSLTFKARVFIETTLPLTGIGAFLRTGIAQTSSSQYLSVVPLQGLFFEWSPDQNSGNWRVAVGAASVTYTNTSVATAADTAYDLELDVNAAWTQVTFLINGVTAATVTTGIPTTKGNMFAAWNRISTSSTNYQMALDAWLVNYRFTR